MESAPPTYGDFTTAARKVLRRAGLRDERLEAEVTSLAYALAEVASDRVAEIAVSS